MKHRPLKNETISHPCEYNFSCTNAMTLYLSLCMYNKLVNRHPVYLILTLTPDVQIRTVVPWLLASCWYGTEQATC